MSFLLKVAIAAPGFCGIYEIVIAKVQQGSVEFYVAVPLPPHPAQKFRGILKTDRTNVWSPQ